MPGDGGYCYGCAGAAVGHVIVAAAAAAAAADDDDGIMIMIIAATMIMETITHGCGTGQRHLVACDLNQ